MKFRSVKKFILLLGIVGSLTLSTPPSQAAESFELAKVGKLLAPVVTSPTAGKEETALAATLANYLGKITSGKAELTTGDGQTGIAVGTLKSLPNPLFDTGLTADEKHREDYVLRTHAKGVYIIGASELGLRHAVWDFLYRLGYRQFFPGQHWEVIPNSPNLKISLDVRESPAMLGRRIWYGFGNWPDCAKDKDDWDARNRMANGMDVNMAHAWDGIYTAKKAEFDKHPEYLVSTKPAKFCVSNPGLRKLVVDWALEYFEKFPDKSSLSLEPSDGGGWDCAGTACGDDKEYKTISDRVVTLANEVAEAVNQKYKNKYIGIYAYYQHCPPPTIRVHPNVVVGVATSFITGGFTFEQLMAGWKAQGATLGIRDYYSVVISHKDRPGKAGGSNFTKVPQGVVSHYELGGRMISAESSDSWGHLGLTHYLCSRLMWDPKADIKALTNDFFEKAFGPAQAPMREFYDLINGNNKPIFTSNLVGQMYRKIEAARALTTDPGIRSRLDDLTLYTRHCELMLGMEGAGDMAKTEAVLRHAYRIRQTHMVHSYAMWRDTRGGFATPVGDTIWNVPEGRNPWKTSAPFTSEEINSILTNGVANNPVIDFSSVGFSEDLVPLNLGLSTPVRGNSGYLRGRHEFLLWFDKPGTFRFTMTGGQISKARESTFTLSAEADPEFKDGETVKAPNDGEPHQLEISTKFSGLHRLKIVDAGHGVGITWDAQPGIRFTICSSLENQLFLRGVWSLYFYVPKGTKFVGGYDSIGRGTLLDSTGKTVFKFNGDYFKVPVPPGQDGKIWKFEKCSGLKLLMTVPPYLATTADELLTPKEALPQ